MFWVYLKIISFAESGIDIKKNYEKFGKSRKNNINTYIITSVWHVNRPRMIKVVAA